jgi:SAM-dependent methyltransferase
VSATGDPIDIVREGYERASYAYRGDTCDLEQSGYGHWLRKLRPRLTDGARVLDLGCGCGVPVVQELVNRYQVTGLDLSPVQIERARTLVPGATFVCADMTTHQFDPGSFDAVIAFYSIINVPLDRQPQLFRSIHRWLAPGGWLLAIVGRFPWTGLEPDFRGVKGVPMYWSHGSITDYRRWATEAGFTIVDEGVQPENGNPGFSVLIAKAGA